MNNYVKYTHHNAEVTVREDLKGKHREHCLCWDCDKLNTTSREDNCPIANKLYAICVEHNLATPVFECPEFVVIPASKRVVL